MIQMNVSFGQIARGTGMSVPHVSRVFGAKRRPSLECASKIANFLGISIDEFYAAYVERSTAPVPVRKRPKIQHQPRRLKKAA